MKSHTNPLDNSMNISAIIPNENIEDKKCGKSSNDYISVESDFHQK